MPRTRSNTWHSTAIAISPVIVTVNTDDPLASVRIVPMPGLNLVFGGKAHGALTWDGAIKRARPIAELQPGPPGPARPLGPIDESADEAEHPYRIELTIDSLPNRILIEPIPVTIDPVGDNAFTAWVHNLDTNATGSSVVEALLLLKERIEARYAELNKNPQLSSEQKTTLQMLHTYIAPSSTKPEWV